MMRAINLEVAMRKICLVLAVVSILIVAAMPVLAGSLDAATAFDRLAKLEGTWQGMPEGEGEGEGEKAGDVIHEFRLSAAGTVVMETMGPGTPHEMINMYHVDGDELVLTHYCAGGNQPTMKLNREVSSADKMVFDFTGGTNLDPEVDKHIHGAELQLTDEGLVSNWTAFAGGKQVGAMTFHLERK